jgi:hypothetical protein
MYLKYQLMWSFFIRPYVNYKFPLRGERFANMGFDIELNRHVEIRLNANYNFNVFSSIMLGLNISM